MPISLLPLAAADAERIIAAHPQFMAAHPAGTYARAARTPTVAVRAQLGALSALPDDLVFAITRALWIAQPQAARHQPHRRADKGRDSGRAPRAPLHPGARRYYTERAVTSPENT